MSREPPSTADIRISGDTLALDPALRRQIQAQAERLRQRHPLSPIGLHVRIGEELDQMHGHRVRCELTADLPGRRQIVVREAQKDALVAIDNAFATAKRQLRRQGTRAVHAMPPSVRQLRPTGS